MKTQILDDNINWIEKNSNIDNIESIKDILTENKESIKVENDLTEPSEEEKQNVISLLERLGMKKEG